MPDEIIQKLVEDLPVPDSALRFFLQFEEQFPSEAKKLRKDRGLLSDILTLVSFSPLLAATLVQNPSYVAWLKRQRVSEKVRNKDEILESLARFDLVNSGLDTNILLARFRRRELLRIYLRDIRNLGTIAEITEEISNLADAIMEYALRMAAQQLDNRFGIPLETDENGRTKQSSLCIVALGKLGSKELNYSSDIDLLYLYSAEGLTSSKGKNSITNREYFVKLAQTINKAVGGQTGEGAAYRVDLRLRPNGRVGALATSIVDAIKYYKTTARSWERQVLIRSRACAGDANLFGKFFDAVKSTVFSVSEDVEKALENVRLSKEQIDLEKFAGKGIDVKLGKGGIREIEFIAQALQLAYGGTDEWIRASHTLISLNRLADRNLLTEKELTQLFEAYVFLRRLEHRLQMENGLQTHFVPDNKNKRLTIAKRMRFESVADFSHALTQNCTNVNRVFLRIFGNLSSQPASIKKTRSLDASANLADEDQVEIKDSTAFKQVLSSIKKSDVAIDLNQATRRSLARFSNISPYFAQFLAANPNLAANFSSESTLLAGIDLKQDLVERVANENGYSARLAALRIHWSAYLLRIAELDAFGKISIAESKALQTNLAEASIEAAVFIVKHELQSRFQADFEHFPFGVLGLGKLGGAGMDYGSDLDLILIYDDDIPISIPNLAHAEFYNRAVEIFVTALSSITRHGLLYRVDLRLRPDGNNGPSCSSKTAFLSYLESRAAIWEWLAYVKLRGVGGDLELAKSTELAAKSMIHQIALRADIEELRLETLRVRERLQNEKSVSPKGKEIDIKFSEGGMLDVYFAVRFLQLRDNVPDDSNSRSTASMILKLYKNHSLCLENFRNFSEGYDFLSKLDHTLRLVIGRSTLIPLTNTVSLQTIIKRMEFESFAEFNEQIAMHRLNIRESYLDILKSNL